MTAWNKGKVGVYKTSEETKLKQSLAHKGIRHSSYLKGDKHPNWMGGLPKCKSCPTILKVRHSQTGLCRKCIGRLRSNASTKDLRMKIRHGSKYQNWRTSIFQRDDYTCQTCKERGGKLTADHIIPFSAILKISKIKSLEDADKSFMLWWTENGRTLCEECHKKTITYMRGWNGLLTI